MRLGHCCLAACLFRIGKHPSGLWECGNPETVKHVVLSCRKYSRERRQLFKMLADLGLTVFSYKSMFFSFEKQVEKAVLSYLRHSGLYERI